MFVFGLTSIYNKFRKLKYTLEQRHKKTGTRSLTTIGFHLLWHTVVKQNKIKTKKGKRKVQGVPQSQTAALPRPREEDETDKSKQAQTEQTYEKH